MTQLKNVIGGPVVEPIVEPIIPIVTDEPVIVKEPIVVADPVIVDPIVSVDLANIIKFANEDGTEVECKLDASGNALKEDGTVLYTAAEIKAMEEPDEDPQIVAVSKLSGISILDDAGLPKVYDDTIEGFAKRESDIKNLFYQEGAAKGVDKFFEANPEIAALYEYKRVYGTLEGFANHVDYATIELTENNPDLCYDTIYKAELKKGNSPERAKRITELSKIDGTLLADAKDAANYLGTAQKSEVEAANAKEFATMSAAIEAENNYFGVAYKDGKEIVLNVENSIYDLIVVKGSVGKLQIPIEGVTVKDPKGQPKTYNRRQIFDYINNPVKEIDGMLYTQAQLDDANKISNKDELLARYMSNLFGGNLSALIETSKLKDKADQIRTITVKHKTNVNVPNHGGTKVVIPVRK